MSRASRPTQSAVGGVVSQPGQKWFRPRFETLEARYLLSLTAAVMGRHLLYDNSKFDGGQPGISALDNSAVAPDKVGLKGDLSLAGPENVSSYTRGINGIMVDISGSHPDITSADFTFRMGNNNSPLSWTAAPAPSAVSVWPGAGVSGSDRVEIVWSDGVIRNTYLQVIVGANSRTGLVSSDAFFFGSRVGDSGIGTQPTVFQTNSIDSAQVNAGNVGNALIDNPRDFNRSGNVNSIDGAIVNANNGSLLRIAATMTAPAISAHLTVDSAPGGATNSDGISKFKTMSGTLTTANPIVSFKAGLNNAPVTSDALATYNSGTGQFSFNDAFMVTLNGGAALADGTYVLHVEALDSGGLGAAADVTFTLDTVVTPLSAPDLIAADDAGTSPTDNITKINTPRIDVPSETGATVKLFVDSVLKQTSTGGPALQFTLATLSNAAHTIHATVEDLAGNTATTGSLGITVSNVLPTVTFKTPTTLVSDLTPHVSVTASSPLALANGTQVTVDVDLDYNGSFSGASELNHSTSTLYAGKSNFQLTQALPANVGGAAYYVQLRARVSDVAGNEGTSTAKSLKVDRIGNSVLDNYVTPDATPTYNVVSTLVGSGFTVKVIDLTSQTWRAGDVNLPVWKHWLQIYIPDGAITNTALLLIDGGSNTQSAPTELDDDMNLVGSIAQSMGSVLVHLPTVPSEPLKFLAEPGQPSRSEDAIIAYTFDQYANHLGAPGNETWPLLLPMVQSAVAAMDTTQAVLPSIEDFVVTGYSKRGWTTWLTAAMDDRVRAIIPGVIDILNMGEQMLHHYNVYGAFAPALNDYTAFGISAESFTNEGWEVGRVVDPYSYIYNGRFDDMPKLLINSTGDEFFLPDAAENYFSDLPGTQNYLRYIPNTSHSLNDNDPVLSTISFFDAVVNDHHLPEFSWQVGQDGSITLETAEQPLLVNMYQATNPNSRDFRKKPAPNVNGPVWSSSPLTDQDAGPNYRYVANVNTPAAPGATAFMIEILFPNEFGFPFVFTTQIKIATNKPDVAWPFFMPTNPPPGGGGGGPIAPESGLSGDGFSAIAFALAGSQLNESDGAAPPATLLEPVGDAPPPATAQIDEALASDAAWIIDPDAESDLTPDDDEEVALILLGDDLL